jgi:hypothetical protein
MNKKRLFLLSGAALVALLLVGLIGVTAVSAQEPTPEPQVPFGWHGVRGGRGGFGCGMFGLGRGDQWTMFDVAAEALGLTPEELFAELHAGKSLTEIAEAKGVDVQTVYDAMSAARAEAGKQAIQQAVEDGRISQEQADWMLQGLEKGWMGGHGFGRGFGPKGGPPPQSE